MAASGSRHAGRVVDPLVRDDGETEPELELSDRPAGEPLPEPEPEPGPAAEPDEMERDSPVAGSRDAGGPERPSPSDSAVTPGIHPVRARLLAKAASAVQSGGPRAGGDSRSVSGSFERADAAPSAAPLAELDAFDLGGAPSAPRPPPRGPLSPNMIALFGTLLGLATVASILAVAMRFEPGRAAGAFGARPAAAPSTGAAVTPAPSEARRARTKIPGPWRVVDAKGEPATRVVEGSIGTSAFLKALQEAGLDKKEAYRVFSVLKELKNLDKCDKRDTFVALVDRASSRIKAFEYAVSKEEVYQLREGADGVLAAARLDFKIERTQVRAAIVPDGGDLDAAAERAGLYRGISRVLGRALDGHVSLDELERGDVIRLVAQEVSVLGEFARYAGVEAVEVRRGDRSLRLYYFRGASERGYYDDKGRALYEGGWRKPVKDAPITSKFNPKRMHPVLHKIMPHTGVDFGAPMGAPVGASSYGTVSFVGYAGPSGNLVKVEHGGEIETGYAHLSKFAEGLKVGDKVKRLGLVGYVGSTGRSTGPHLHFTAKKKGEFIDPETLNLDGMRVIGRDERDAFTKLKQQYDALLDAIPLPAPLPAAPGPIAAASAEAEGDDEFASGGPGEPTAGSAAAPTPAPPPSGAPAPAAPPGAANPVYLTDKELMKSQAVQDDGEVED